MSITIIHPRSLGDVLVPSHLLRPIGCWVVRYPYAVVVRSPTCILTMRQFCVNFILDYYTIPARTWHYVFICTRKLLVSRERDSDSGDNRWRFVLILVCAQCL